MVLERETQEDNFSAREEEPLKKKRRTIADPDSWKKNIRKKERQKGHSYINRKDKVVPAKVAKIMNCKCRFRCSEHLSPENQMKLFKEYWDLANPLRQKMFLCTLVKETSVQRTRKRSEEYKKPKSLSRFYYLPNDSSEKIRVCQKFFLGTFNISHKIVSLALKGQSASGAYHGVDGRIGRPAPNITPARDVAHVKKHIDSFPRMESHYCRRDSKKLYLNPDLSVAELYRLYTSNYCTENQLVPVTKSVFRKIFKSYDPPLCTYKPKKDQCSKCNQYRDAKDKSNLEESWKEHVRRKTEASEMKKEDMDKGKSDPENIRTITFDLQAILTLPFAGDCQIFYKRKLSLFNFTIYDSKKDGYCYLWDETHGKKGSSEIGTCILHYLLKLPETVTHVISYADTCGGQNRNQHIAALLLYAVNNINHLKTFDLKFMESGHSHLEVDSMHATIERIRKHRKIYTPNEYALLIGLARRNPGPYKVEMMNFSDFLDLQNLSKSIVKNVTKTNDGDRVNWLKIKWLRFDKNTPYEIQFKYNLSDLNFQLIDIRKCVKTKRSSNKKWPEKIEKKYIERLPISIAKKRTS